MARTSTLFSGAPLSEAAVQKLLDLSDSGTAAIAGQGLHYIKRYWAFCNRRYLCPLHIR